MGVGAPSVGRPNSGHRLAVELRYHLACRSQSVLSEKANVSRAQLRNQDWWLRHAYVPLGPAASGREGIEGWLKSSAMTAADPHAPVAVQLKVGHKLPVFAVTSALFRFF